MVPQNNEWCGILAWLCLFWFLLERLALLLPFMQIVVSPTTQAAESFLIDVTADESIASLRVKVASSMGADPAGIRIVYGEILTTKRLNCLVCSSCRPCSQCRGFGKPIHEPKNEFRNNSSTCLTRTGNFNSARFNSLVRRRC